MPGPRDIYARQAERYYFSGIGVDARDAIAVFRQDVRDATSNLAIPVVGLFLAAAKTVGKVRIAPFGELTPQDILFPQRVWELYNIHLEGLRFEIVRRDMYNTLNRLGTVSLSEVTLDTGFGYEPTDQLMGASPDGMVFQADNGEVLSVDCADLSGVTNAQYHTNLAINPAGRHDLLERIAAAGYEPEPPQQL